MKICPLRAWIQSSFSITSPIPSSGMQTTRNHVETQGATCASKYTWWERPPREHPKTQHPGTRKHAGTEEGKKITQEYPAVSRKIKRDSFVPAYPITEAVSGHPHICDQEHRSETASMGRKKTKQKTGISHKELGQDRRGCVFHNAHTCILNISHCA